MRFSIREHKKLMLLFSIIAVAAVVGAAAYISTTPKERTVNTEKPENFVQIQRDIAKGITMKLCNIEKSYYVQPSFYPTWEATKSKPTDKTRWGVTGFGAFPAVEQYQVNNMVAGNSFTACTFIRSGWTIQTYQGMHLEMIPASDLFDIRVTPENTLLAPTYPAFIEGWAQKATISVTAKTFIPAGTYTFNLRASAPPQAKQKEYYDYVMDLENYPWYDCSFFEKCDKTVIEQRKRTYYNAGDFSSDKFFKLTVVATGAEPIPEPTNMSIP